MPGHWLAQGAAQVASYEQGGGLSPSDPLRGPRGQGFEVGGPVPLAPTDLAVLPLTLASSHAVEGPSLTWSLALVFSRAGGGVLDVAWNSDGTTETATMPMAGAGLPVLWAGHIAADTPSQGASLAAAFTGAGVAPYVRAVHSTVPLDVAALGLQHAPFFGTLSPLPLAGGAPCAAAGEALCWTEPTA